MLFHQERNRTQAGERDHTFNAVNHWVWKGYPFAVARVVSHRRRWQVKILVGALRVYVLMPSTPNPRELHIKYHGTEAIARNQISFA